MAKQMSLFPFKDPSDQKALPSEGDGSALDEVFSVLHHLRNGREYFQMLEFIGRLSNYSAFNAFLLYLQNPDLTFVATAGTWRKRFNRYLKPGARPLMILAPMSPVRFVFDSSDTEGDQLPPNIGGQESESDRFNEEVFENTVYNCALHGIMVRQVKIDPPASEGAVPLGDNAFQKMPESRQNTGMNYLILLHKEQRQPDQYAALVYEMGQIFCGHRGVDRQAWWPDRRQTDPVVARLEAASIAFLVCRRIGLYDWAEKYLANYRGQEQMLPLAGFNTILQAANYIEEMGRSRWQKARRSR